MLTLLYQSFKLCKAGEFNFSFESLTSVKALCALRDVQKNDPEHWSRIALRDLATESEAEDPYQDKNEKLKMTQPWLQLS